MHRMTVVLTLVASLLSGSMYSNAGASPPSDPPGRSATPVSHVSDDWAQSVLDTLSLSEKVGQLLVVQETSSIRTDPSINEAIAQGIGSIRICQRSPLAQADFLNGLQYEAPLPLLITQNTSCRHPAYERPDIPALPMTALAATRDRDLIRSYARKVGQRAQLTGVHQIYGPEPPGAGLGNPGSPNRAGDLVEFEGYQQLHAYINGVKASGLLSTTSYVSSILRSNPERYIRPIAAHGADLRFERSATPSVGDVLENVTVSWPSSSTAPAEVIRPIQESTRYRGLVSIDVSISGRTYNREELHELALDAMRSGANQLIIRPADLPLQRVIVQAVREGRISRHQIDHSVIRILRIKQQRRLNERRVVNLDAVATQTTEAHWGSMNREIARRSLTLLSNDGGPLPLSPLGREEILSVTLTEDSKKEDGRYFRRQLRTHTTGGDVIHRVLNRDSPVQAYDNVIAGSPHYDAIIVSLFLNQPPGNQQRRLLDEMQAYGQPVIVVNFGPGDLLRHLSTASAALLGWTGSEPVQEVAAQAIFGRTAVTGRLPQSFSPQYPAGSGVTLEQRFLRRGTAEEVGMRSEQLQKIDRLLYRAVADSAFPGAAVAIGRGGVLAKLQGYGYETYESARPVTAESMFDLASLTKVIATTTAAMMLYEEGRLALHAPVSRYWPAFGQHDKNEITIRHLLTHTSGLRPFFHPYTRIYGTPFFDITRPFTPFFRMEIQSREDMFDFIASDTLEYDPGEHYRYSDFNMITLMRVIEEITGTRMDRYLQDRLFDPLGMTRTGYRGTGPAAMSPETVPTEFDRTFRARLIRGEVHDEAAYIMGGVSGHAGLFSTAYDLALFADMLIRGGKVNGMRFVEEETIDLFTTAVNPDDHTRALGWDTRSPDGYSSAGDLMGPKSFGHTGFTGTSFWIDPEKDLFVILLTNRVHPTRANRGHIPIRPELADRAYRSIGGPAEVLLSELLGLP